MNIQNLEVVFGKLKGAFDKFQVVKQELAKIQQEIEQFLPEEGWKVTAKERPIVGQKVLTAEINLSGKEVYNVVLFKSPDELYKFWLNLNPLPTDG